MGESQWINKRTNERMSELMNRWVRRDWISVWVSLQMNERVSEQAIAWVSECVCEWVSQSVILGASERIRESCFVGDLLVNSWVKEGVNKEGGEPSSE